MIYVATKDQELFEKAPKLQGEKSLSATVKKTLEIAIELAQGMTMGDFARSLGYADWENLMKASERVDDCWVTRLPDGRWATWVKLSPD